MAIASPSFTATPTLRAPSPVLGKSPPRIEAIDRNGREALTEEAEAGIRGEAFAAVQQKTDLTGLIDDAFKFIKLDITSAKDSFEKILETLTSIPLGLERNFAIARCRLGLAHLVQGKEQQEKLDEIKNFLKQEILQRFQNNSDQETLERYVQVLAFSEKIVSLYALLAANPEMQLAYLECIYFRSECQQEILSLQREMSGLPSVDVKSRNIAILEDQKSALLELVKNKHKLSEKALLTVGDEARKILDNPLANIIYVECVLAKAHLHIDPGSSVRIDMTATANFALTLLESIEEKIITAVSVEEEIKLLRKLRFLLQDISSLKFPSPADSPENQALTKRIEAVMKDSERLLEEFKELIRTLTQEIETATQTLTSDQPQNSNPQDRLVEIHKLAVTWNSEDCTDLKIRFWEALTTAFDLLQPKKQKPNPALNQKLVVCRLKRSQLKDPLSVQIPEHFFVPSQNSMEIWVTFIALAILAGTVILIGISLRKRFIAQLKL